MSLKGLRLFFLGIFCCFSALQGTEVVQPRIFSYQTTFKDFQFEIPYEWELIESEDDEYDYYKWFEPAHFDDEDGVEPSIDLSVCTIEEGMTIEAYLANRITSMRQYWDIDGEDEADDLLWGAELPKLEPPTLVESRKITVNGIDMLRAEFQGESFYATYSTHGGSGLVFYNYKWVHYMFIDKGQVYTVSFWCDVALYPEYEPVMEYVLNSIKRK